jgi:gliding motility-associated-like protein
MLSPFQKKSRNRVVRLLVVMSALLAFVANPAKAQLTPQMTPTGWPYSGIGYWQYLPPGYNSTTDKFPIVMFMHGLGEKGSGSPTDLNKLTNAGPLKYIKAGADFPFILIAPQLKTASADWYPGYMNEVMDYAIKNLRVDETRIYITGLSLGGGGAWSYSETYFNKVAAVAPICGHYNNPAVACTNYAATNMPIWAFHGDKDTTVPIGRTQMMIDALRACIPAMVPQPIFTIYPGVGHNSWDNAYRNDHSLHNPNVYEWMMGQRNTSLLLNAGADVSINLPQNSTTLTATASSTSGTITSYAWTKVTGPSATMTNPSTATLSLTDLVEGVYVFRITVTNSLGQSLSDDVQVSVIQFNQAPTANAGADVTITLPTNSVNLTGSGSDNDGSITSYAWVKQTGPAATLGGVTTATLSLSNLVEGTYVFVLTVTDNKGATATDAATVIVKPAAVNQLPVVSAGADFSVNLPTATANITGTASDPDGSIASYLWEKTSGGAVTLTNANTATVSLSGLVAGIYKFRLTVTDNKGATASAQVTVTVIAINQTPNAYAGDDIIITLPTNSTNIIGAGVDPDGSITAYAWSQVTGPNTATLTNPNTTTVTASNLVQGAYQFRITVTDNKGATATDIMVVTVNAAPVNVAPTANAGPDKSITLPLNTIVFNGSGADSDGSIASYAWSLVTGPPATLVNQNTANLTANNLVAGSYTFRLTVTDDKGATGNDLVSLVVNPEAVNQAPVANAGADVSIVLPTNTVTLNGSGTDPDGTVASYAWTKVTGPAATLSGAATATLSLSNLLEGSYIFRLTVTDNKGATGSDDVAVNVTAINVGPTANAGSDIILNLPANSATLMGSGTDPDGIVSNYLWTQTAGPNTAVITNQNTSSAQISALVAGNYTFRLTVTDDDGADGFDEVKVVVNAANLTPTANAGADKTITLPTNSTNFTGFGTDSDGTIASYAWTQLSGPPSVLSNANTATVTVTASADGIYVFRLTVTDNQGASNFDDVQLTVKPAIVNQPPVANAGSNKIISLPQNSLNITGQGSDPDGSISSYSWVKLTGPSVTLTNAANAVVSLSNLLEGNYTFRLTVTDNGGLTASDDVDVTVLPAAVNQVPVANAGPNINLTLPLNSTTLLGSGSDPDGSIASYAWTKVTGPAATLANANTPTLTVTDLVAGLYTFRLTVVDDKGATDIDDVDVTVNPLAANQAPSANAGTDKVVTLPTTITTLNGSGSDPDGFIAVYTWFKLSGPSVTLGATNLATLSLSDLTEGTYEFQLMVQDDKGLTATDEVTVSVLPEAINQAPIADAGNDQSIFLPTTSVILLGQGSDIDGSIATFTWTQVGGSSTIQLVNANTPTLTVNNLSEGTFLFRLTVEDNKGSSAFDEVVVSVFAPTVNQPPSVSAGSDISMKLPQNSTTISSNSSDPDGTVDLIEWTKITGPSVNMTNTNTAILSLANLEAGNYTFRVTVTDNEGGTGFDEVNVVVLPATINLPPVVSAGPDASLQLPQNAQTLTGVATDDGIIQSVLWTKISGGTVTLSGETTTSLGISNLVEGTYVFRLTATDDQGLTGFDDVTVSVAPEAKVVLPPTVNAGPDQIVQLPVNSITIEAVAESPDGILSTYTWVQTNGSPVTIQNGTSELQLTNLIPGSYSFRITVEDAIGQTASDDITILVMEEDPIVKVPDLFSPDGRGDITTETWTIENAFLLDDCEVIVYNRQGQKVYASKGYPTPWNGTYRGTPLPAGAYFYVFLCGGQKKQTGSVAIVRAK